MNITNLYHALIAIAIQLCLAYFVGWYGAAAAGVFFYVGREYTQVEHKVRARTGISFTNMRPSDMGREYWTLDNFYDVLGPVIGTLGVAALGSHFLPL